MHMSVHTSFLFTTSTHLYTHIFTHVYTQSAGVDREAVQRARTALENINAGRGAVAQLKKAMQARQIRSHGGFGHRRTACLAITI